MTNNQPQPRDVLAADLCEAFAQVHDDGTALDPDDARRIATALMEGLEGSHPAARADLFSAYRPGVVTNLAYFLPEHVTIRNLATVLGCELVRARTLLAGRGTLHEGDLERLAQAYDIRADDLTIRSF